MLNIKLLRNCGYEAALEAVDEEIEFSGCELTLSFSYSGQTSFTLVSS